MWPRVDVSFDSISEFKHPLNVFEYIINGLGRILYTHTHTHTHTHIYIYMYIILCYPSS